MLVDEVGEFRRSSSILAAQARSTFGGGRVVQQREKVFDRDELMALLPGFDKGHVQTDFKLLRDHFSFPP